MLTDFRIQLKDHLNTLLKTAYPQEGALPLLELEVPIDKAHGEFSTNIALRSAKMLKKPPVVIAQEFCRVFNDGLAHPLWRDRIAKVEVKNPGFINFFLTPQALCGILEQILKEGPSYGRSDFGKRKKVQVEFVSANPTGPLTVAHARQAAVGDALVNILDFIGFDAKREYYINDGGNQINILGVSIKSRAREILGAQADFPENGYQGAYIREMAQMFLDENKIKSLAQLEGVDAKRFTQFGVAYLMDLIKKDLNDFNVHFDIWSHESKIATSETIPAVLEDLRQKGVVYEHEGALWFKSTAFGDDKDRVVRKSDGSYTYLMPDIVYHKNKFERGFEKIINIWGPDHHGYIPRLKAAVEALGKDRGALAVLIVQLATIYRNGEPVSMSTRRGEFISLREVMDEVGADAARFFFLMRHIRVHLDFDLELAKKQTPENPVYYIQYAYARINSINKKAQEAGIHPKDQGLSLLKEEEELGLIKKLGNFSDILMFCHNELDPYPLVSFSQELATAFHKFYDRHRVITEDAALSAQRLALINATKVVLANSLRLLGLSAPERM